MKLNLSPAQWVWYPSARTLANTFVLFRRDLEIGDGLARASGWIVADSRYRLTVDGQYVQWGPAPADPRWPEADPIDLAALLPPGRHTLGVEVLHYGHGEGTWPMGKPGLLLRLDLEHEDGTAEQIVSDESWLCRVDWAHRPGQYRRFFLRALQEEFDARLHPHGWDGPNYSPDESWLPAMPLDAPPDKPSACASYFEYANCMDSLGQGETSLLGREIPLLRNENVAAHRLRDSGRVRWFRDPEEWFAFRTPGSLAIETEPIARETSAGWQLPAPGEKQGLYLTFEFEDQIVGWPYFTIDAPAGTIVELMVQESHDPKDGPAWLDSHIYSWSRFVCREGLNHFETFDFESLRWLQLHIRNAESGVVVRDVGIRRRRYDWPQAPTIRCGEPVLQRLIDASLNTLHNCAQETCVDGMGRERQQYSGDVSHQLHAIRYAFGETRLPARFLRTFSQGMTLDGYFLDCWPGYDRLARIAQRQVGMTMWGPLLDHGIGFCFDCWHHYLETGDLEPVREAYPRLKRMWEYLPSLMRDDGLLAVEDIGVPAVWIDHWAYTRQRHKACAFNLYAAGALLRAMVPLCAAFGENDQGAAYRELAERLHRATVAKFWCAERGLFVNNLPWLDEEGGARLCDRSLAESVLFDFCPAGQIEGAVKTLAERPPEMGLSYPANAVWRYGALCEAGRADIVVRELREIWAAMPSVILNNTLQEDWKADADSMTQWSHCPLAPLVSLFTGIAGIRPTAPGFARCQIRPQLADLRDLSLTAHTPLGPILFVAAAMPGGHRVEITVPEGCEAELLLPTQGDVGVELHRLPLSVGLSRFQI